MLSASKYEIEKKHLKVKIITVSGEEITGILSINRDKEIHEVLNGTDQFLEIETAQRQFYLAKNNIAHIGLNEAPKTASLENHARDMSDPYQILGVAEQADFVSIRENYHHMLKNYHPDRFNGLNLPNEVMNYLQSMSARINWAFDEIKKAKRAA